MNKAKSKNMTSDLALQASCLRSIEYKYLISSNIIVKITSLSVQSLVLEQGRRADPGSGLFVPSLIPAHLWWCEGSATDSLLLNSVISVAPVWKPVRMRVWPPCEGD